MLVSQNIQVTTVKNRLLKLVEVIYSCNVVSDNEKQSFSMSNSSNDSIPSSENFQIETLVFQIVYILLRAFPSEHKTIVQHSLFHKI
jgi:hypothetical protein